MRHRNERNYDANRRCKPKFSAFCPMLDKAQTKQRPNSAECQGEKEQDSCTYTPVAFYGESPVYHVEEECKSIYQYEKEGEELYYAETENPVDDKLQVLLPPFTHSSCT